MLGSDHAEVGGWLAERWGLPADMVEAIALHHSPERAEINPQLTSLIHIADSLAERTGHVWPEGADSRPVSDSAWEWIEPDGKRRQGLLRDLVQDIRSAVEKERELFQHFRGTQEN